jgi:hypothetical protein
MPINNSYDVRTSSPVFNGKGNDLRFSTDSADVNSLVMANGIYNRYEMDWYKKFTRFGIIDPYNAMTNTREYVFITKPDLCLMDTRTENPHVLLSKNPFFVDAIKRYHQVARQLQSSVSKSDGPFMTMLSNSLTSTLDLPGISADTIETAGNIMGTRINYRGTSYRSDQDFDFNLEFEDTKYLDIYMLFKMYDEYEKLKWNGALEFNNEHSSAWVNYIVNKVLHDQVTMYKFVVGEDGSRIIYWARITGCIPTSIPRDAFGDMTNTGGQKLTVGWKGHFVRDMDPLIISHFNLLVKNKVINKPDLPLFNTNIHAMDGRWSSTPYIEIRDVETKHGTKRDYFLKWKL